MKKKAAVVQDQRTWGIRAGVAGEAHSIFMAEGMICLADPGMGNLRRLEPNRQAFYSAYRALRSEETRVGTAGIAGKFYRFIHEIALGDWIVYYSLIDKRINVGRVVGEYVYKKVAKGGFPHRRAVKWNCAFGKSDLSESANRELGAARTLFEVKRHRAEIKILAERVGVPGRLSRVAK